jgi:hypothetical protein
MSNATRRSFLKASLGGTDGLALAGVSPAVPAIALDRRAFLRGSVGAAAGVAVVTAGPRLATATLAGASNTRPFTVITPSGPPPAETVMAYLRDAARGEITVLSGTRETTYRDPELVKRLLDAAR